MRLSFLLALLASTSPSLDQTPSPTHAVAPTPTPTASPVPTPTPGASPSPSPSPSAEPTPDTAALLALADEHYSRRSIGAIDEVAPPHTVEAAIELYRRALSLEPHNIEILARLMRALHFRGAYTGSTIEEKRAIFDEGRRLGQGAVDRLEAELKGQKGLSRIEALRLVRGTPALYLWTAGHWGEWGLVRGKFAAARSGAASRVRDLAQTVIEIDPLFEDGAGYRILGRLHAEAPSIVFITGWVSREKALLYLRRAHQIAPSHPTNSYFLAEAILDHEPGARDEAIRLLEQCVTLVPRPDFVLEDSRYARVAHTLLDQLLSVPRPFTGAGAPLESHVNTP